MRTSKFLVLFTTLTLHVTCNCLANWESPDLGDPQQAFLNKNQEALMGKQFMHAVRQEVPLLEDNMTTHYLQKLGSHIAKPTHHNHYQFFAVNENSINAFAGPGGYIGINAGLINTTQSEAELAAVLAHEIMHVEQRHIARRLEHSSQRQWPSIGAVIGAILIGSQIDSTLATGAILGATAGQMQQGITMTRQFELEADRLGIALLDQAGLNVYAMPDFFARMQQKTIDYGNPRFKILRTHPVTQERIADSLNRAKQYPIKPDQIYPEYTLIRTRVHALTAANPETTLNYYENAIDTAPSEASHYGYALALARLHQPKTAATRLKILIKNHPNIAIFHHSLAQIQSQYDSNLAQKSYHEALRLFPNNMAILLDFAALLMQSQHYHEAIDLLKPVEETLSTNPQFQWFYSQALGQTNHLFEAYCHRAEMHDLLGQPSMALIQLKEALKHASNYEKKLKVNEKIRQISYDIRMLSDD